MQEQQFGRYDSQYDVRYRFMNGECHVLALQLKAKLGWPLVAVVDDSLVLHVAISPPGHPDMMLDVKGLRPVESFAQHHENSKVIRPSVQDVQEWMEGEALYLPTSASWEVAKETAETILHRLQVST